LILPWQQIIGADGNAFLGSIFTANRDRKAVALEVQKRDFAFLEEYNSASKSRRDEIEKLISPQTAGFVNFDLLKDKADDADEHIKSVKKTLEGINKIEFQGWGKKAVNALKSVGQAFVGIAAQALTAMAVTLAIEGIVTVFDNIINASQKAIDAADETKAAWESLDATQKTARETIDQYGERYDELSEKRGKPSGLSTSEYEEYKDICNELASVFPELVSGWDEQGNAILRANTSIKKLEESYQSLLRLNREAKSEDFAETVMEGAYARLYSADKGSYTDYLEMRRAAEELARMQGRGENAEAYEFVAPGVIGDYGQYWFGKDGILSSSNKFIEQINGFISSGDLSAIGKIPGDLAAYFGTVTAAAGAAEYAADEIIKLSDIDALDYITDHTGALKQGTSLDDGLNQLANAVIGQIMSIELIVAQKAESLSYQADRDLVTLQDEYRNMTINAFDRYSNYKYGGGILAESGFEEDFKNYLERVPYAFGHDWFGEIDAKDPAAFADKYKNEVLNKLRIPTVSEMVEGMYQSVTDYFSGDMSYGDLKRKLDGYGKDGPFQNDRVWSAFIEAAFGGEGVQQAQEDAFKRAKNILKFGDASSLEDLTFEQLSFLAGYKGESIYSLDELNALMKEDAIKNQSELEEIIKSYTDFNEARTKSLSALSALSEQGHLTPDEWKQLQASGYDAAIAETQYGSKYVDYQTMRDIDEAKTQEKIVENLEAKALKQEKLNELTDEHTKLLAENSKEAEKKAEEIKTLENEIDLIDLMNESLLESTSALNAFKQASSMAELGDNFRSTKEALDAINEGLESGRVGTNKFKAALELLGGRGMLERFESGDFSRKELKQYTEQLGKYYDEDGNINRSKAFDTFVKEGIGRYFKGENGEKRFAFNAGTTMAQIQEKLGGITEEMATYFLDAINEYAVGANEILGPDGYESYQERAKKAREEAEAKESARIEQLNGIAENALTASTEQIAAATETKAAATLMKEAAAAWLASAPKETEPSATPIDSQIELEKTAIDNLFKEHIGATPVPTEDTVQVNGDMYVQPHDSSAPIAKPFFKDPLVGLEGTDNYQIEAQAIEAASDILKAALPQHSDLGREPVSLSDEVYSENRADANAQIDANVSYIKGLFQAFESAGVDMAQIDLGALQSNVQSVVDTLKVLGYSGEALDQADAILQGINTKLLALKAAEADLPSTPPVPSEVSSVIPNRIPEKLPENASVFESLVGGLTAVTQETKQALIDHAIHLKEAYVTLEDYENSQMVENAIQKIMDLQVEGITPYVRPEPSEVPEDAKARIPDSIPDMLPESASAFESLVRGLTVVTAEVQARLLDHANSLKEAYTNMLSITGDYEGLALIENALSQIESLEIVTDAPVEVAPGAENAVPSATMSIHEQLMALGAMGHGALAFAGYNDVNAIRTERTKSSETTPAGEEQEIESELHLDNEAALDAIDEVKEIAEEPLEGTFEVDPTSAETAVTNVVTMIETITTKPVDANTEPAEGKVGTLDSRIRATVTKGVDTSQIEGAISLADALHSSLSRPATKRVTVVQSGGLTSGGSVTAVDGGKMASSGGIARVDGGAAYAGGTALVGEIAPEIIVDRKSGTWRLVDYPQLTHLNPGDIVFNGEQTKDILAGKRTGFSKAFVDGNVKGGLSFASGEKRYLTAAMGEFQAGSFGLSTPYKSQAIPDGKKKSSGGGGSSRGGSGDDEEKDWKDWIVRVLEIAKEATEKAIDDVAKKIGYLAQNAQLDVALKANQNEIEKNEAAQKRYMEQAAQMQREHGLSADIVKRIQEGTIDITKYDQEMLDKIDDYQTWFEKAEDCRKAVEELKEQELELQRQKLDNIDKYYNHKIDRLEAQISKNDSMLDRKGAYGEEIFQQDYVDAIKATQDKIAQLQAERKAYAKQFDVLVKSGALQPDSNEWHEYISTLEEVDESIIETQTDLAELKDAMENIKLTNLQYALDRLEALQDALESFLDFHDSQGVDNNADTYIDLIQNAFDEIDNLEMQNEFLRGQQEGLDVLSEKWQELQQEIESNEQSIWEIKSAQEDWNDTIADLQIQMLEREREELEKTNDALERRKEMEDALEDLEKAKSQRTKLIYREGKHRCPFTQ